MKKGEELWNEALDNLDEKYINEAAEKLAESDSFSGEQRSAVHMKIPARKSRAGTVIGSCASAAAAVCLVAVGVFVANNRQIDITVADTSDTSVSANAEIPDEAADIKPQLADSEGYFGTSGFSSNIADEDVRLDLYEESYFGEWTEITTGEKLVLSYSTDCVSLNETFCGIKAAADGLVFKKTDSGRKSTFYYISENERDLMYRYSDIDEYGGSVDLKKYDAVYSQTDKLENQREITDGQLGTLGIIKLISEMSGKDSVSYNRGENALRIAMNQKIPLPNGKIYANCFGKTGMYFELSDYSDKSFTFCTNYVALGDTAPGLLTLKMEVVPVSEGYTAWNIVSITSGDEEMPIPEIFNDTSALPDELYGSEFTWDFSVFEKYFYGRWVGTDSADFSLYDIALTYQDDVYIEPENGAVYCSGFYSDAKGWYMRGLSGGIFHCYYIPSDNPDYMYYYDDVGGEVRRNNYSICYKRKDSAAEYDTDVLTITGKVSSLGFKRIKQYLDFEFPTESEMITIDGDVWSSSSNIVCGVGNIFINELITDDRLVLTKRYIKDGTLETEPVMQYLTLTFEKSEGRWILAGADKYRGGLETLNTPAFVKSGQSDSEVEYFTDTDGLYYAVRRYTDSDGRTRGEIYRFDGTRYAAYNENGYACYDYEQEDYSVREIGNAEYAGGKLYVNYRTPDLYSVAEFSENGSSVKNVTVSDSPMDIDAVGDKFMIAAVNGRYFVYDISSDAYLLFTADSFLKDSDGLGFTAEYEGKALHMRADVTEMTAEEQIDLLNIRVSYIWTYTQICSPNVDDNSTNTITTDSGIELYPVTQSNFKNYSEVHKLLSETYTPNCVNSILSEDLPTGMVFDENEQAYCNDGARGSNIYVGKIECEIKSIDEAGNMAELQYTAYSSDLGIVQDSADEVYETYTMQAIKTDGVWRLNKYYSPY